MGPGFYAQTGRGMFARIPQLSEARRVPGYVGIELTRTTTTTAWGRAGAASDIKKPPPTAGLPESVGFGRADENKQADNLKSRVFFE
jgi:hypothetical protein